MALQALQFPTMNRKIHPANEQRSIQHLARQRRTNCWLTKIVCRWHFFSSCSENIVSTVTVRQHALIDIVSHEHYSPGTELTNAFGALPREGGWNILRATLTIIP